MSRNGDYLLKMLQESQQPKTIDGPDPLKEKGAIMYNIEFRRKTRYEVREQAVPEVTLDQLRIERARKEKEEEERQKDEAYQQRLKEAELQARWDWKQWQAYHERQAQEAGGIDLSWFKETPAERLPHMLPPPHVVRRLQNEQAQQEEELLLAEIEQFFFEEDQKRKFEQRRRGMSTAAVDRSAELMTTNPLQQQANQQQQQQRRKPIPYKPIDPDKDSPEQLSKLFRKIKVADKDKEELDSDEDIEQVLRELEESNAARASAAQVLFMEKHLFKQRLADEERRKQHQGASWR